MMDTNLLLAVIGLVIGVVGAGFGAGPVIDKIRNKKLTKKYKSFILEILSAIFNSEKIYSTTDPKDIQREVETIVQNISNRYFNKPRPLCPPDPIREAIFGEHFIYHLECNLCKELHQPDAKGSCKHCGLPAPLWCLLGFKSLKDQHKATPFNRMKDRHQNGPKPRGSVEFPHAPSSSNSQRDKNH